MNEISKKNHEFNRRETAYQTQIQPQQRRVAVRQPLREHHRRTRTARETDDIHYEARPLLLRPIRVRVIDIARITITIGTKPGVSISRLPPVLHGGQLRANVRLGLVAL
jgi:hypothetical protein